MGQPAFDTLAFVKRLSAAGMNARQAEALAEALTAYEAAAERFPNNEYLLPELRVAPHVDGGHSCQLVEVGAGSKRAIASAGDDDDAHPRIIGGTLHRTPEIFEKGAVESVQTLRPVEGQTRNGTLVREQQIVKHGSE